MEETEGQVKEQILQYHIKIDKIKLRGDIYDEFNSFNEMNQFNLSETEQFNDGLAFFGVQVIIDSSYWDNVRMKLKELEDRLKIAPALYAVITAAGFDAKSWAGDPEILEELKSYKSINGAYR